MPPKTAYAAGGLAALLLLSGRRSPNTTTAVEGQQNTLQITRESEAFRQTSRGYSATVSGGIRPLGDVETAESDSLSGSTATGYVTDGVDTYVFTGEIESLDLGDGLVATVNGQRV